MESITSTYRPERSTIMKSSTAIYICDDNALFAEEIRRYIPTLVPSERTLEISIFTSGADLITACGKALPDAVLLDIDMPELDGFEVSGRLRENFGEIRIIFVTGYDDRVYGSWEYNPFWFVRKSHITDLKTVLPRLLDRIDSDEEKKCGFASLCAERELVRIDLENSMLIDAFGHNLRIINADGTEKAVRCRVADAECQLSPFGFVRIQNGILVNLRFVARLTSKVCIMQDGREIGIGRKYLEGLRHRFAEYLRRI